MRFGPHVESIWGELRSTRHDPPTAAASDPARRSTYVSALEQAEQLFAAAAEVGPASRPLLIFYGLSQAGRALAAAAGCVGQEWRLAGHGIHARDLEGPLPECSLFTKQAGSTSFVRLSAILASPTWGKASAVALSDLWDLVPEMQAWPLRDGNARRTPLFISPTPGLGEWEPSVTAVVCGLPSWLAEQGRARTDLDSFMSSYPTSAGYWLVRPPFADRPQYRVASGRVAIELGWRVTSDLRATSAERDGRFHKVAVRYRDDLCLFPTVGENAAPLHPLMAWWAILFALSMLARYQPAAWRGHIDVDRSAHAVPVENLLSEALTAVPELILQAIREVA